MARLRRCTFGDDDRGVSVMVGALLLVGIFVASMVTIRVAYVPAWEEDREAATARDVAREFAHIRADLDRLVTNGSALPVAHQLTLTERSDSMFRLPSVPSSLQYTEGDRFFRIESPTMNLLNENGTDHTRLNETYTTIDDTNGNEILDLGAVLTLRLRVDEVRSGAAYNNSQILVNVRDRAGDAAGSLRMRIDDGGTGYKIIVETTDRWGTVIGTETVGYPDGLVVSPFTVDAHDPRYRFNEVMRVAAGPIDLNITHAFPAGTADFTATYTQNGIGGTIIRTSGGHETTGYQKTFIGGTLQYDAHNRYFVANGWRLEHGALILVQSDGAIMEKGPSFRVGMVRDDILRVALVLPHSSGAGTSISGFGSTTLSLSTESTYRLVAEAPELTFNLTTRHPDVWAAYWNETLTASGLTDQGVSPQFTLTTGTNWVRLRLIGFGTAGADDLYLDLHQGTVRHVIEG